MNRKYENIKGFVCDLERLWFGNDRRTFLNFEEMSKTLLKVNPLRQGLKEFDFPLIWPVNGAKSL